MMNLQARSEVVRTGEGYEAPPPRDRLPTLPEDLSEYAWIHTGPPSWSSERSARASADEDEVAVDGVDSLEDLTAGQLVDLWHSDVPNIVASVDSAVDAREARLLELLDGEATIGTLLETSGLALPDVLGAICELCARGVITLDRSQRVAR